MILCFFGDTAAEHLRRWSLYFLQQGHQVHVITFNDQTCGGYDGVSVHIVRKFVSGDSIFTRVLSVLPMLWRLRQLLRKIKPDIIHSHSAGAYAWIPSLLRFRPLIITPWGNDILIDINHSKIERLLTTWALRYADIITCDGVNMEEALVKLGTAKDKIHIIIFGVDINRFTPALNKSEAKQRLQLRGAKIIISTRVLSPVHDVETFIRAIPKLHQQMPELGFVIVGGGPEKERLEALARELGVRSEIRFTGRVSEQEMINYLQAADVYVSTSLSESGLAASTAEAMACGLPVVNTDTGDIKLWLEDGRGGFVMPIKNSDVLAEKVVYILRHGELVKEWGSMNRAVIEERNNYYREMQKMERYYLDFL